MSTESAPKKKCFIEDESERGPFMVQFHLPYGVLAMPYGHILGCSHQVRGEHEAIEILFSTRSVLIEGIRLARGFDLLADAKLKVAQIAANESELKGHHEPWVKSIRSKKINEGKDADEATEKSQMN